MFPILSSFLILQTLSYLQVDSTPAFLSYSQGRNLIQFGNMISLTVNKSPLDYNGYGCWCGLGGQGKPVDETDACCKAHDECYDRIMDSRPNVFACSPYISTYSWDLNEETRTASCKDKRDTCAFKVCECDRIATECYKKHIDTFDKSLKCPKIKE